MKDHYNNQSNHGKNEKRKAFDKQTIAELLSDFMDMLASKKNDVTVIAGKIGSDGKIDAASIANVDNTRLEDVDNIEDMVNAIFAGAGEGEEDVLDMCEEREEYEGCEECEECEGCAKSVDPFEEDLDIHMVEQHMVTVGFTDSQDNPIHVQASAGASDYQVASALIEAAALVMPENTKDDEILCDTLFNLSSLLRHHPDDEMRIAAQSGDK